MLRDRIVSDIRDDVNRKKLPQVGDLKLDQASEAAGRQLKAVSNLEDVQLLQSTKPPQRHERHGDGDRTRCRSPTPSATRRYRSLERSCHQQWSCKANCAQTDIQTLSDYTVLTVDMVSRHASLLTPHSPRQNHPSVTQLLMTMAL